jgi:hypothetical protein
MTTASELSTFDNPDVIGVCTRLLNEATTTRMNLTESVREFLRESRKINIQVERYLNDYSLDEKEKVDMLRDASFYLDDLQETLVQYSKECYSDETPDVFMGNE